MVPVRTEADHLILVDLLNNNNNQRVTVGLRRNRLTDLVQALHRTVRVLHLSSSSNNSHREGTGRLQGTAHPFNLNINHQRPLNLVLIKLP